MTINNTKTKLFIEKYPFEYVLITYFAIQKECLITSVPFQGIEKAVQRLLKWGFIEQTDEIIKYVGCPMFSTAKKKPKKLLKNIDKDEINSNNFVKFACWFHKKVCSMYPEDIKLINAERDTWVSPVRLMIEQDKRDLHDMAVLADKVFKDDFWKKNVRSTAKFRDKYGLLKTRLDEPKGGQTSVQRKKRME